MARCSWHHVELAIQSQVQVTVLVLVRVQVTVPLQLKTALKMPLLWLLSRLACLPLRLWSPQSASAECRGPTTGR